MTQKLLTIKELEVITCEKYDIFTQNASKDKFWCLHDTNVITLNGGRNYFDFATRHYRAKHGRQGT